ncbi:MAG: hypothetical protein M5R36_27985 [Deltaproteobacteria bacterium]|nr:hypothetical protein [Deltaproteobacteria bacterium]
MRRTLDKAGRFFAAASGLTRRTERRPGRDLRVEAEISLAESYTGATRTFHYGRDVDCDACKGRGFDKVKTCAVCEGVGSLAASWMPAVRKRCPRCAAKGWIGERTCTPCEGTGRVRLSHTHTATVPEGTPDGARVRVKGQGEGGYQGGDAGDLIIKIRVAPEPGVRRDGDDLVRGLPVDFRAAALGGQADLALPDGKTITLRIPPWSTSGRRLRVVGRGFKDPHSDRRGDLFAVLRVDLPHESDADARSLTLRYLSAAAGSSDIRKDELRDELEAYFAARA